MDLDRLFNPLGLPVPPWSPAAMQWRMAAFGFEAAGMMCRFYQNPGNFIPGPAGEAVRQMMAMQAGLASAPVAMACDALYKGLAFEKSNKPLKTKENPSI